jgi:hypothetical protein
VNLPGKARLLGAEESLGRIDQRVIGPCALSCIAQLIAIRTDVVKATQGKQVPWEHSALMGRSYFAPARPEPKARPPTRRSLIKDTNDPQLLRRFIEQFPGEQKAC